VLEVRIVITCGLLGTGREEKGHFESLVTLLFLDIHTSYVGVPVCENFSNCTYIIFIFFFVCFCLLVSEARSYYIPQATPELEILLP
jgi:hypothetical protein